MARLLVLAAIVSLTVVSTASARPTVVGAAEISSNWSGYEAGTPPGAPPLSFTDVTGTWTVPRVACGRPGGTSAAFWVGIGGASSTSPSLEQLGSSTDCSPGGVASYRVWTEIIPAPARYLAMMIGPGDRLTAATSIAGQTVTFSLKDLTRGTRYSTRVAVSHPLDTGSAEWIAEAPSLCRTQTACDVVPLARFGSVGFSNVAAIADGQPGTLADPAWLVTPVALVTSQGIGTFATDSNPSGALPGPFSPDGRSFSIGYHAHLMLAAPPPTPLGGAPLPAWIH